MARAKTHPPSYKAAELEKSSFPQGGWSLPDAAARRVIRRKRLRDGVPVRGPASSEKITNY
jgi:hypothetical protein